jgi:hypothetical protein
LLEQGPFVVRVVVRDDPKTASRDHLGIHARSRVVQLLLALCNVLALPAFQRFQDSEFVGILAAKIKDKTFLSSQGFWQVVQCGAK